MTETFERFSSGGIWSVWDIMFRFHVASFSVVMGDLARMATAIAVADSFPSHDNHSMERSGLKKVLNDAQASMTEARMSRIVQDQYRRLLQSVDTAPIAELGILTRELYNNAAVELSSALFLSIPEDRRSFYEQKKHPFGDTVASVFRDANADIAAASRCFALDEWTACVFHLMRVLEHGLRWLSQKVGLQSDTMAAEQWKNVIDQIEKKIRELESATKSPEKTEMITLYSGLAVQFRYFKDAWRNHVSHARSHYDQREGEAIYQHVRLFMEKAATNQ